MQVRVKFGARALRPVWDEERGSAEFFERLAEWEASSLSQVGYFQPTLSQTLSLTQSLSLSLSLSLTLPPGAQDCSL